VFIIVQFPLADLRSLIPGQRGRLDKPNWSSFGPATGFVRGFGKIAERNESSLGLEGESIFADFDHALKFPNMIDVADSEWGKRLHANVWFRRLYFDGRISGRFEVAFRCYDDEEERLNFLSDAKIDVGRIASVIENSAVIVLSPDTSSWNGRLVDAGKALGLAYIAATTAQSKIGAAADVYDKEVVVGPPRTHIRINANRNIIRSRDEFHLSTERNSELFVTSSTTASVRKSVLVQTSEFDSFNETPEERVTRVLFAHLNALTFALGHLVKIHDIIGTENKREILRNFIEAMIDRFSSFDAQKAPDDKQKEFLSGIKKFGSAYAGRIPELADRLQEVSDEWSKPTTAERGINIVKSLYDVVVRALIDKGVDMATGQG
jgi:hypothetical protein